MFRFPFGTTQELNLDWFLEQWEIFKQEAQTAFDGIDHALDDEIQRVEDAMTDLYAARDAAIAARNDSLSYAQSANSSAIGASQSAQNSAASAVTSAQQAQSAAQSATSAQSSATNAGTSAGNALTQAQQSEAWATGEIGGVHVPPSAPQNQSNAKQYATNAQLSANAANTAKNDARVYSQDSKAWATGIRDGQPVTSEDETYHNNAKYYAESIAGDAAAAAQSASNAAASATSAAASAASVAQSAEDIDDLENAINEITKTVQGPNIFDQENATTTDGKYLNPSTGNEGTNASYCYVNDYIPVEEGEQYFISVWNKQTGSFVGNFNQFTLFYDENKTFISGLQDDHNPITIPENGTFIRISMTISGFNSQWYMIEKSSTHSQNFVPYSLTYRLKLPYTVVDINGNGEFTTINDAVDSAENGSVIIVTPGVYEENVKAWGKEVHIIGLSREACVIRDTSGNYSTPPLEIGAGSIQNMTIIEEANGSGSENQGAYAVHVESNNLFNEKLLIRNCYIYSDSSSAIGMGLRGGCSVRIEDCEIICAGARVSTGAAPLYFHDADAQAYWGTANLYLHNNVLRNTASTLFSMLTINSIHAENTTYMHMMYNIFVRSKTPALPQKFNTWNSSGNTDADGWNGLSHMYLEDDSFGNNQTELNYSV